MCELNKNEEKDGWIKQGKKATKKNKRAVDMVTKNKSLSQVRFTEGGWEKISLKIDSGAIDTVIPKDSATKFPTTATQMSKSGQGYKAANGTEIPAYGERALHGYTDGWMPFAIKAQVAGVKSALGSVHHMIKNGNQVVFDSQGSYVRNKQTGQILEIQNRDGSFELDLWVQEGEKDNEYNDEQGTLRKGQRYTELIDEEEQEEDSMNVDFLRQVSQL